MCLEHHRSRAWTSHCTLASQVSAANTGKVIALAAENIEPFEVLFSKADCVEFIRLGSSKIAHC